LEEALAGLPFEAAIPGDNGTIRVRALPFAEEGPLRLIVAFEPEMRPVDRLRNGGLETSEVAFLVRHLRQGLWRLDSEEKILDANEFMAAWLETTIGELLGTSADQWRPSAMKGARYEAEFQCASGLVKHGLVLRSEVGAATGNRGETIELITDITAEQALKAKLVEEVRRMSKLARTDVLTGLHNRMVFEERLAELQVSNRPFGLLVVDLDDLKMINDAQGHAQGDQAIIDIGMRIRDTLRTSDVVARIGGDEFAAILPDTTKADAEMILDRLRERLGKRASVGLAHSEDGDLDVAKSADEAMYRHKRSRKAGN
jgi:diguanylate cyclase (GGDEF)-like protein